MEPKDTIQHCPICLTEVKPYLRYPKYVCQQCAERASALDGRLLSFGNTTMLGSGFAAKYADDGSSYSSGDCYIDGIKCYAEEAYMGGIVIQSVE